MNVFEVLAANQIVYALGWTLLHSLWQAALVAMVVGLAFWFFRHRSANFRYLIGITGLGLTVTASLFTFIHYYSSIDQAMAWARQNPEVVKHVLLASGEATYLFKLRVFLNQNLPEIVALWAVGFGIYLVRYFGSYLYCQRLRRLGIQQAPQFWHARVLELSRSIGLFTPIDLKISQRVNVPCVVGHFRPLILVPAGLMSNLDVDQVEAILLHELAHIRRHDYLIGLGQGLIKTVFFFNPFLLWISSRVDSERENACDDIAVKSCKDRLFYAKALEQFAIFSTHEGLAMAATGNNHSVFIRIKRLLERDIHNSRPSSGLWAGLLLVTCSAVVSVQAEDATEPLTYSGIESLSSAEIEGLLDEYEAEVLAANRAVTTTLKPQKPLEQLSADEKAIFVGYLKQRIWDKVLADWSAEDTSHFKNLSDKRWEELRRLWFDQWYGHEMASLESGYSPRPVHLIGPNGERFGEVSIYSSGKRLEATISPAELDFLLQSGEIGEAEGVAITRTTSGSILLSFDQKGGLTGVDLTSLAETGTERQSAGLPTEEEKNDPDFVGPGERHIVFVGKDSLTQVELSQALVQALATGEITRVGDGTLGAEWGPRGLSFAVAPALTVRARKVADFLDKSFWAIPAEDQKALTDKIAKIPDEFRHVLWTDEEWDRHLLAHNVRTGRGTSPEERAFIKHKSTEWRVENILKNLGDPEVIEKMGWRPTYQTIDNFLIAIRNPVTDDTDEATFGLDVKNMPFAQLVRKTQSHCPDDEYPVEYHQLQQEVSVLVEKLACEDTHYLLQEVSKLGMQESEVN